ncbi:MAG: YgiT-type zinc finger protein [Clostridia bacterium]|nr:YgiT-type zinc finger protein [Clostridia bacterium]
MGCVKCGETAYKSVTSEAIELGFGLLVIRNIPCYKCEVCDEILYTGDVVQRIEAIVSEAKQLMQALRVIDYDEAA